MQRRLLTDSRTWIRSEVAQIAPGVLDVVIGVRAHGRDGIVIATYDDVEPDRRFVFEDDPSDDGRARRNVMVVAAEFDAAVAQKVQHCL